MGHRKPKWWGTEAVYCRGWRWREVNREDSYSMGLNPQYS